MTVPNRVSQSPHLDYHPPPPPSSWPTSLFFIFNHHYENCHVHLQAELFHHFNKSQLTSDIIYISCARFGSIYTKIGTIQRHHIYFFNGQTARDQLRQHCGVTMGFLFCFETIKGRVLGHFSMKCLNFQWIQLVRS